jgi:HK97 gp10 family phage protein
MALLIWKGKEYVANIEKKLPAVMNDIGKMVQDQAKSYAPVLTGYLRDNIINYPIVSSDEYTQRILSKANYSIYQELGTYKMKAHPYLRPAIDFLKKEILRKIQEIT